MPHPRRTFVLAETLEPRRFLAEITIDNGFPTEETDGDIAPALRIYNRWSLTASGWASAPGTALTLTWSIVPDGTIVSTGMGEPAAPSDLQAKLNALYGSPLEWMPLFQQAFDYWSEISGVTFVQDNDDGTGTGGFFTNAGALGVRGDIRIGAHHIDGALGTVAYNWYPDRADMVIDSDDLAGGGALTNLSNNSRALKNVLAHEIGHALGFEHVGPVNHTKLMEATLANNFDGPQFDDQYTVNRSYGDIFEKPGGNNAAATASNRGVIGGTTDFIDDLSLSGTADVDFYAFTLDATRDVSVTVTPFGPTYLEGGNSPPHTSFNATAQMDLQVELLAGDGTTVLASANATGVGFAETLATSLAAGTYYIKVSPAPGAGDRAQMYTVANAISGDPIISTTVALSGDNDLMITDIAAGGKRDGLTITADASNARFIITDPINFLGTSIAGAGGSGTHTVTVPFFAVAGGDVYVSLLGGDDVVSVSSGSMPFTIDGGAGTDTINVTATSSQIPARIVPSDGDDTINVNTDDVGVARVTFALSQTIGTLAVGAGGVAELEGIADAPQEVLVVRNALKLSSGAKVDLRDNSLALNFYTGSSPIGAAAAGDYNGVLGLVQTARAGGAWTGNGLTTTQSAAAGPFALMTLGVAPASQALGINGNATALFNGQTIDASTVLVGYTFAGDTNLDRTINGDDFFNIDSGFASAVANYFNGDLDYSGAIDADDYFAIDSNYNDAQPPPPATAVAAIASEPSTKLVFAPHPWSRRRLDELA